MLSQDLEVCHDIHITLPDSRTLSREWFGRFGLTADHRAIGFG
jgi:hypothetical protein